MHKLLVASHNHGKLHEIRGLLKDLPIEVLSPYQLGLDLVVEEDGLTYQENAVKKVVAFSELVCKSEDFLILADDSGLEVDVLNGQPGIYSARLSIHPGATDTDRRSALLAQLKSHPRPWSAQFRCLVVLSDPGSGFHYSEGICGGEIIPEERGTNGFGFDPIFLVKGMVYTMAELTTGEKNVRSHRALAIHAIKPKLVDILKR